MILVNFQNSSTSTVSKESSSLGINIYDYILRHSTAQYCCINNGQYVCYVSQWSACRCRCGAISFPCVAVARFHKHGRHSNSLLLPTPPQSLSYHRQLLPSSIPTYLPLLPSLINLPLLSPVYYRPGTHLLPVSISQ